jgi:hypothetical protein
MTLSPEDRAKAVFEKIIEGDSYDNGGSADVPALIASAIRQAENDALERAAELALEGHDEAWGHPAEQHGWEQAAQRIRSLKHKD